MTSDRALMIGSLCAVCGLAVGGLITAWVLKPSPTASLHAAAPNRSTSPFFKNFDPNPIVESISGRRLAGGEVRTDEASASGGGLSWGERRYIAIWASPLGQREQAAAGVESQIDRALADAGMVSPNSFAGEWVTHPKGAVFRLERRYQAPGHRGRLRGWLLVGDQGQQSSLILTVDEDA